jgi:hypothetical protein
VPVQAKFRLKILIFLESKSLKILPINKNHFEVPEYGKK